MLTVMYTYSFIESRTKLLFLYNSAACLINTQDADHCLCLTCKKIVGVQLPFLLLSVRCPALTSEIYCVGNGLVLEQQLPFARVTLTVDGGDGA